MRTMLAALAAALALAGPVQAQQWPSKPVRVIVNVAPGGVADITARVISARLTETLGQPFVVENRPGGDGYIGFEAVRSADPDGYTVVYAPGSTVMIAPHLVKRPDLDPLKVLVPIAPTGRVSLYVIVHPKVPAATYPEFLAYLKVNPGKLDYGTPGNGTSPHIATEVFLREADVKMVHVPYKGAGPALKDLLGGVIEVMFDPGPGLVQAKAGTLRMIAIAGPRRHPDFPGVPTLEEHGVRGVDGGPHFGFYGPAAMPREAVQRFNREVAKVMQEAAVLERFRALAVDLADAASPDEFAAYVRFQHAHYGRLLPVLNIKQ